MTIEMVVLFLIATLVTWLITFFFQVRPASRRASEAEKNLTEAKAEIGAWKNTEDRFSSLASKALNANSEHYLKLVSERYNIHDKDAKNELDNRQEAIKTLVSPISKSLSEFESKVGEIKREYGSVTAKIGSMNDSQDKLRTETNRLVNALQRPEGRGAWGELQFRNVVEMAGMANHVDFEEQITVDKDKSRPDATINLPDNRLLVVDIKTPINSYLEASKTSNEDEHKRCMKKYVKNFRESIDNLSSKSYWDKLDKRKCTPDFVVMFVPGEAFFSAALNHDPDLVQYGAEKRVVIASPTTLIALLKTVAYCWQQHKLAKNVEAVSMQAKKLFESIKTFANHLHSMRKALEDSVKKFNESIGSLERNVLPKARKFVDLGVVADKEEIKEIPTIEENIRKISAEELLSAPPENNDEN